MMLRGEVEKEWVVGKGEEGEGLKEECEIGRAKGRRNAVVGPR